MWIWHWRDIEVSKIVCGVSSKYTKSTVASQKTSNCHSDDNTHIGWAAAFTSWGQKPAMIPRQLAFQHDAIWRICALYLFLLTSIFDLLVAARKTSCSMCLELFTLFSQYVNGLCGCMFSSHLLNALLGYWRCLKKVLSWFELPCVLFCCHIQGHWRCTVPCWTCVAFLYHLKTKTLERNAQSTSRLFLNTKKNWTHPNSLSPPKPHPCAHNANCFCRFRLLVPLMPIST